MARLSLRSDILLASPSDIRGEMNYVEAAVSAWNAMHSDAQSVIFRPIRWERDVVPAFGGTPQDCINTELVDTADGMIALLWSRLGAPTSTHISGTAEEIDRFITSGRRPAVYVCKRPLPSNTDGDQLAALHRFEVELHQRGLVFTFDEAEQLQKLCFHYLTAVAKTITRQYQSGAHADDLHGAWNDLGEANVLHDALSQLVYLRRQIELLPETIARRPVSDPLPSAAFSGSTYEHFVMLFEEVVMRLPEAVHLSCRNDLVALVELRALTRRSPLQGGLNLEVTSQEVIPVMLNLMFAIEDAVRSALADASSQVAA